MSRRDPVFFVSYAQTASRPGHGAKDRYIREFFDDLSEMVSELVALPVGVDPGYMANTIPGGAQWTAELSHALGTCQVFVALISPPYLTSAWCGREWGAFATRKVHDRQHEGPVHTTAILPIVWARWPEGTRLPEPIEQIQRFMPDLPDHMGVAEYNNFGLLDLKITNNPAYNAVVWRIAQRIAEVSSRYEVVPRIPKRDELHDIFGEAE